MAQNWTFHAYDPSKSKMSRVEQPHNGKYSVKIVNLDDNDSDLEQEVHAMGGRVYRVSGWIKTEGVEAQPGQIGANLCVPGTYIRSTSLKGTQPWTRVEFYVRTTPGRNSLKIACRLGYWGSTVRGTAWFDDIMIEEDKDVRAADGCPVY